MFQVCPDMPNGDTFSADIIHGKKYQDTGSLICHDGYKLTNNTDNTNISVAIECTAAGQWNVTTITCDKKGTI